MADQFENFIGGRWVPARSGARFERENPATGAITGSYPRSGAEDVRDAVCAAADAAAKWRRTPAPRRGEILFRAAEILVREKERFARELTEEMGKVIKEARGDIQEAIDMTYYMAGEGRRAFGQTTPSELPDKFAMSVRAPVGVVGCITPWNFPMAIPSWKIMPALVTGNTVVFKPSQFSPKSAYNLIKTLEEAGIPPGVVNLVFGEGAEVGGALIEHPSIELVSFTGSNAVGQQIAVQCAQLGKPVSLEMGGKNAITVLDDADLDLALEGVIWSAFGTTGQRCTAASRVIVQAGVYDAFAERLVARAERLRLGDGLDPQTDVGPVVNTAQLHKIDSYMAIGREEGATIACGGDINNVGALGKGYFFQPTVFTDATPQMRIAQEEIFGPVTALIRAESLEEAIAINNGVPYGLSSSIYTRDVNKAFKAVEGIDTGLVYVNAGTIGAEVHLPFGGTRGTGNGHREAGTAALDTFTEWKTVYIDYSGRLQKAQIDVDTTEEP
ncbi:MAG TPA: aldehyde dehydrogenase family protein [Dehalococcoidia bacterium]|nr:aldehyde dehydrogenase family protein [Dehalococcoidia bacterium]